MKNITFIFSQAILRYGLTPFLFVIISSLLMIIITAILVYKEVKGVKIKW
jgi:lipopolysaccharide export LptBFGC system permease protein LptF